jgi:hypothetical protein
MEETLYLFKNEYEIAAYAGEILTKRVGDIIVETIVSPTPEQLKDYGYKPLQNTVRPDEKPGYIIETYYENTPEVILQKYRYVKED